MITIQEAHKYLSLVNDGFAKPIVCGNNDDHPALVSWLNDEDEAIFICLACSFKIKPGYKMAKYIQFVNKQFKS